MQLVLIKLVQRIREEFEEHAPLRVTPGEAAQYFGLEVDVCARVLDKLNQEGFLIKEIDGRYGRM